MFQLYKNIQTDFLGQIFLELCQFKARSLFGTPCIWKNLKNNVCDFDYWNNFKMKTEKHNYLKVNVIH